MSLLLSTIPKSKENNLNQVLCDYHYILFKHEIILHILRGDENNFFDLEKFFRQNYIKEISTRDLFIKKITDELKLEGWNIYLGFGDTGLFIYSTTDKPINAF